MASGQTSNSIANEALALIGNNMPQVSGFAPTFDNSAAGIEISLLYTPTVQAAGRMFGWDFARRVIALTVSGNPAPMGFSFEYLYPGNGIEVWQLVPVTIADPFNPLPEDLTGGNTLVSGVQTKVLWSNLVNAQAVYNNAPAEAVWDPGFAEAVTRLLASKLAMALAGRPDTEASMLASAQAFLAANESRAA